MKPMEFDLVGAERFFKFMASNGIHWWYCEALPRKKNGERGAKVASKFKKRYPFPQPKILEAFKELISSLQHAKKIQFDLHTRESPSRRGARVILIDDTPRNEVYSIRAFWSGPLVILETSPENFQALLISPRELNQQEYLRAARFLANRFNGDPGAAGPGQLHRFPGSPNWKAAIMTGGRPFLTRLVACWQAEEGFDPGQQLTEMLRSSAAPPTRLRLARPPEKDDRDNSAQAFRWTLHQLNLGTTHEMILAELRTRWLGHHDAQDWPIRTLHNALYVRGDLATRYKAS